MLKELLLILKQGAVLAVGNVGQRILQFALLPIYTRLLSPADFGIIEMLTIFCTFFSLFALLGTRQGFTRNYLLKEKNSAADSQNKDKVLNTSIWFVTIWGILLSVLGLYFSDSLGHFLLKSNDYNNLMIMSIFWGLGLAFNQIPQAHFLNNGKMGTFVIISTVQLLINLGLIIYWVVWYKMGVEGIIRANAITQLTFGLGLNAVLLIKHRYFINVSILKKILRFGVPAMFSGLLITSFYMIDRLF
nr:oligosaccharide flippase family protein [candidate division KSB1 bacterium]